MKHLRHVFTRRLRLTTILDRDTWEVVVVCTKCNHVISERRSW